MAERVKVTGGIYRGKVPDGAVYVGRAWPGLAQSPFANPWVVRRAHHAREVDGQPWVVSNHRDQSNVLGGFPDRASAVARAVQAYREHLDSRPDLVERARVELAGKDLACWCKPTDELCHADVLLAIAAEVTATGGGS